MWVLSRANPLRIALIGGACLAAVAAAGWAATGPARQRHAVAVVLTGGDPSRAPALMRRYGCSGCHTIPGVPGADGLVGGPLIAMRKRVYIAGVLPNEAGNLQRWIVDPPSINPRTAMPATGITPEEARDVVAYLYAR